MAISVTRARQVKSLKDPSLKNRNADTLGVPTGVTEVAQTKVIKPKAVGHLDMFKRERISTLDRPSTSSGPTTNFHLRSIPEKRTKDDLDFNSSSSYGRDITLYNFPHPGLGPTKTFTLRTEHDLEPPPKPISVPPSSARVDPPDLAIDMAIGMALGSPTHPPASWHSYAQLDDFSRLRSSELDHGHVMNDVSLEAQTPSPRSSRQKSKWKVFGGLFGPKRLSGRQDFYQVRPESKNVVNENSDQVVVSDSPDQNDLRRTKTRHRSRTNSIRRANKNKPQMKRANTAPMDFDFQTPGAKPMSVDTISAEPIIEHISLPESEYPDRSRVALDVDIPSVEMERYSVMFNSILQKPPTSSASSLLARRQATVDKLVTIDEQSSPKAVWTNEESQILRSRRATSPQPAKSPVFSLFPQISLQSSPNEPAHLSRIRPAPLQRPQTSPAALSPSRSSFGIQAEIRTRPDALDSDTPTGMSQASQRAHHSKTVYPQRTSSMAALKTFQATWNRSKVYDPALDSPDSCEEESEPLTPTTIDQPEVEIAEPAWQMVTKQSNRESSPANSRSSSVQARSRSHSSATSYSSTISIPSSFPIPTSKAKQVLVSSPPAGRRYRSATMTAPSRPAPLPPKDPQTAPSSPPSTTISQESRPSISTLPKKSSQLNVLTDTSNADSPAPSPSFSTTSSDDALDSEQEKQRWQAASISIARQISVSRQQRQFLGPIRKLSVRAPRTKPSVVGSAPLDIARAVSPLGAVADEQGNTWPGMHSEQHSENTSERLVPATGKPSTPTLVVVGEEQNEWLGVKSSGSVFHGDDGSGNDETKGASQDRDRNRKSELVVLGRVSMDE